MRHGGSVLAPDAELAIHYARELYGRRQESVRLWVVRRADIVDPRRPGPAPAAARSLVQEARRLRHARQAGRRPRPHRRGQEDGSDQTAGRAPMTTTGRHRAAFPPDTLLALEALLRAMADDELDHRLLGLRVDRHRADPRGGRGHELAGPGRDRPRPGAATGCSASCAARTPTRWPTTARSRRYRHCRLLDHPRTDWAFTIARRYLYDEADAVRLEALAESAFAPLADLVAKIRREEVYHRMHASAWLRRLADDTRRGPRRGWRPPGWPCCPTRRPSSRRCPARSGWSRRASWPPRMTSSRRAGGRPSAAPAGSSGCPCPGPRPIRRTAGRATATPSAGCGTRPRWSVGSTPRRPGDGARGRRFATGAGARPASVRCPSSKPASGRPWRRSPTRSFRSSPSSISGSSVASRVSSARIHVELLPTFVGCHALEVIQGAIADRLAGLAPVVEVEPVFDPPWTSDRITAEGRRRLASMGVAPPGGGGASPISLDAPVACPHCGSSRTRLENAFGPTQCRTIRYCTACRNPFEAFKAI